MDVLTWNEFDHRNHILKVLYSKYFESEIGMFPRQFKFLLRSLFKKPAIADVKRINGYVPCEEMRFFPLINEKNSKNLFMRWLSVVLDTKAVFLVVDVQNDFISGSLALDGAFDQQTKNCSIVPIINSLVDTIPFRMVFYSLDSHPTDHISFIDNVHSRKIIKLNDVPVDEGFNKEFIKPFDKVTFDMDGRYVDQIVYPGHCIQNTWGSELHNKLKIPETAVKIHKGKNSNIDSYSVFKDNETMEWTKVNNMLKIGGITDVYICGLAYDICVYHTALDSIKLGYKTIIIEDCCYGTNKANIEKARNDLLEKGCLIVSAIEAFEMEHAKLPSWEKAFKLFKERCLLLCPRLKLKSKRPKSKTMLKFLFKR